MDNFEAADRAGAMSEGDQQAGSEGGAATTSFWNRPAVVAALIVLAAVPLLYPKIPPLMDLLGHMGRYRVQLDIGDSEWLSRYYEYRWAAIGNLGVDLLVIPLAPIFGLELAVKLIVLSIPPLTVAGFLWVAREVHGDIPPTALFALPFAYAHPFLFGFVNFALSIALAFLAFALWLRLGRLGKTRLRSWLFVPISIVVFFAHAFGWGVLGLLCFSAEAVRQHDRGAGWVRAGWNAGWHVSVMALPLAVMVMWRSETSGTMTSDWFNWETKWRWFLMSLRDQWKPLDRGLLYLSLGLLFVAVVYKRLTFSRNLAFSALVLLAGFIILPRVIFSSAYADMRLIPYVIAVALLAIRLRDASRRVAALLAVIGLAAFLVRIGSTTVTLAVAADDQQEKLQALDHVSMGARVVTLFGEGCGYGWPLPHNGHIGAMVIVRKQGFSNDQWAFAGQNLLEVKYREARPFATDPSERVRRNGCGLRTLKDIDVALRQIPRDAFDYLWLVDPPPFDPALVASYDEIASGDGWLLYRITPAGVARQPAIRRTGTESGRQAGLRPRTAS